MTTIHQRAETCAAAIWSTRDNIDEAGIALMIEQTIAASMQDARAIIGDTDITGADCCDRSLDEAQRRIFAELVREGQELRAGIDAATAGMRRP